LNDSYRKRYAKYVQILMVLILAYSVYLGMILLRKNFPTIPQIIEDIVITLLIFAVSYYLFYAWWELTERSVVNYDELDLPSYDSSGVDLSSLENKGQVVPEKNGEDCVGEECCPGKYNMESRTCAASTSPTPSTSPAASTAQAASTSPAASTSATASNPINQVAGTSNNLIGGLRMGFTTYEIMGKTNESFMQNPLNKTISPMTSNTTLGYTNI